MPGRTAPSRSPWVAAALVTLGLALLALSGTFQAVAQALLIVAGGMIFGTILAGAAGLVAERTPCGPRVAAALVALTLGLAVGGLAWGLGSHAAAQVEGFADGIQQAVADVREKYQDAPWLEAVRSLELGASSWEASTWVGRALGGASRLMGALADALLLIVLAFFFAMDPKVYAERSRLLLREDRRDKVARAQGEIARALRRWFLGRLAAGVLVGVMTWAGLAILGLEMAITLAVIAFFLSFIPNFGPLLSALPALLVGLAESGQTALIVLAIYFGVQLVESNLFTPLIQQSAVSLPPALLLAGQLLLGSLFGILGLFLATPIVVALTVAVQRLWVIEVRGESIDVLGGRIE